MDNFTTNILNIYKDKGKKWLIDLPAIIKALASEHNLSDLEPLNNLSYNYVLSGFLDNKPIILKLGLDDDALCIASNKNLTIDNCCLKLNLTL